MPEMLALESFLCHLDAGGSGRVYALVNVEHLFTCAMRVRNVHLLCWLQGNVIDDRFRLLTLYF